MRKIVQFIGKYLFAAGGCLCLFTIGVFRSSSRAFLIKIAERFGYGRWARARSLLPWLALEVVAPSRCPVKVPEPFPADGNISLSELLVINRLVVVYRPQKVFEIGTFDGRTTLNIAANMDAGVVYTLDLPAAGASQAKLLLEKGDRPFIEKKASGARFAGTPEAGRIVQLFGDSATFSFLPYECSMDLVFVDGSHSFDYALNDSRAAMRLVRAGGVILWHDYGEDWEGVTRALDELSRSDPAFRGLRRIEGTTLVILDTRKT